MAQKMLVGDKDTVLLIPATEVNGVPQGLFPVAGSLPITGITSAALNEYLAVNTPAGANSHWGGNITCAILDTWKLEMKDSTVKAVKTLCSIGKAEELTYYNYDAQMDFLRDVNPADTTSEFNLPANLTQGPDLAYLIAHRIGYSRTQAAAAAQAWNFYYAWTDLTVPASTDGEYQGIGETFVSKGLVNIQTVLGS